MEIRFDPIGVIHTPFKNLEGMPIQPSGATGVQGVVVRTGWLEKATKDASMKRSDDRFR